MIYLRALTLHNFALKLGYPSAQCSEFREYLEFLKQNGTVRVQQSGYAGHSLAHSKIVVSDRDLEALHHYQVVPEYDKPHTLYCCPYCGQTLDICRRMKNGWPVLGSVLKVHLECESCSGKFELYISHKPTLRELHKALPFVRAMLRRKRRVSIYEEFRV